MSEPNDRPNLGYSEADGVVTLRMMRSDFESLLACLGLAAHTPANLRRSVKLANKLNRGNPRWTPFEIPNAPEGAEAATE